MKTACGWMTAAFVAFAAAWAALCAFAGDWYLAAQSVGSVAALFAIFGVLKLVRIRPVYSFYAVIIAFTFGAYTLGVACTLYQTVPGYDKLLHMLSGTLTMMLALPLFYVLKDGHLIEKQDCMLAVGFCVAVSLAVAGMWELAEFALSQIAPLDPQCVQATGVTDTMQDMIVCTIGALAGVPSLIRFYRTGRGGFLYAPTEVFAEQNLSRETDQSIHQREREEGESRV